MIPIIGLIIAIYTILRFVQFAIRPGETVAIRVLSVLAALATGLLVAMLIMNGSSNTNPIP